ncbi:MAG TPA: ABC transporter permease [Myxococcales bacterium]|nr:ABC transporter permease [Myxococcales bacterium]
MSAGAVVVVSGTRARASASLSRLWSVAVKEILQLGRDRLTMAMMVALPVIQITLFGYAIDTDVRHVPTVVYDQDGSARSRDFARSLQATGFYEIKGEVRGYDEIERALRSGAARVALVFPPRWSADLLRGRAAPLQLVVDGSDPQTVASATNTAAGLAQARSLELLVRRAPLAAHRIELATTTWYNPDLRSAVYIVPGLVGVILTMTMVMITAMAIARERERGTLEQLIVSPLRRGELIAGKIVPYVAMGLLQMTLILVLGRLLFGVPVVGSLGLLYAFALVFIAGNLALGLFFSTLAQTQQQAMQMSFFFLLPNILLSGFMFPWDAMPLPMQWLSQALPLTHFLRIVRGVALKGSGFADLLPEALWMGAILVALLVLSSLRFRKKLA